MMQEPMEEQVIANKAEIKKARKKEKKLEKMRKRAAKKRKLKTDYLDREIHYGRVSVARYDRTWRKLLIDITIPKMKAELEFSWHHFEKTIDYKDFTISLLLDEFHEAEEQYMMNLKSHVENTDNLIKLFHNSLEDINRDNQKQIDLLRSRQNELMCATQLSTELNEQHIKTMLFRLEKDIVHMNRNTRADYFSKLNIEHGKGDDIIQRMEHVLEKKLKIFWSLTKSTFISYFESTALTRYQYDILKAQDDESRKVLASRLDQIMSLQATVRNTAAKHANITNAVSCMNIFQERDFFTKCWSQMKDTLVRDRRRDMLKRRYLILEFNRTHDYLQELCRKGETLLKTVQVCRKFETLKEKIVPYPTVKRFMIPVVKGSLSELNLFLVKMSEAELFRFAFRKEKQRLLDEKQFLKEKFRNCECIEYPCLPPIKARVGRIPLTEGTFMVKDNKKCCGTSRNIHS